VTEIPCPSCGTVAHLDQVRRDASEFCPTCDYPLFWARTTGFGTDEGGLDGENGLRRLPGTAGRVAVASLFCPTCTEPNVVTAVLCIRCGSDLHPAPPEPVTVILPPPPEPEPEPEPLPEPRRWWPWVVLALIVLALVIIAVALSQQ
jgi:hypothetical protein